MKKILLTLLLVLTACSENKSVVPKVEKLEVLNLVAPPLNVVVDSAGIKNYVISVSNSGDTEATNVAVSLSGGQASSFQLLTSNCPNIAPTAQCHIRLRFDPKGKSNDNYGTNLVVGDLVSPINLQLNIPQATQDTFDLKVSSSGLEIPYLSLVNLGIASDNSLSKVFNIRHQLKSAVHDSSISLTQPGTDFSLNKSTCTKEELNSSLGCQVRLVYKGASGISTASLVVESHPRLNLQAETAVGLPSYTSSALAFSSGSSNLSSVSFDNVIVPESREMVVKIKNTGTGAGGGQLSISPANVFYVTANTCKVIGAGSECQFNLRLSSTKKTSGSYNATLSFGSLTLPLSASLLGNDCLVTEHIDPVTYQCEPNTQVETLAQGSRTRNWISTPAPGLWSSWSYSCNTHYENIGEDCVGVFYTLTLNKTSGGSILDGEDLFCDENCSTQTVSYQYPKTITLNAQSLVSHNLGSFSGDASCTSATCQVVLDGNKTVNYQFDIKKILLTVNTPVGGSLSLVSGEYDYGTNLSVSATPASGYEFLNFSGDCSGSSCNLVMTSSKTISASFGTLPHSLVITAPNNILRNNCQAVSLEVKDINGATLNRDNVTSLSFSGMSAFSDASCSNALSSINLTNQGVVNYYVRGLVAGTSSIEAQVNAFSISATKIVNVYNQLLLSATVPAVIINQSKSITASGGVLPLSWSMQSGLGDVINGLYTAVGTPGTAVVRATDAIGNVATLSLSVVNVLQAGPDNFEMKMNDTKTITVSGGFGPFVYTLHSGVGSVSSNVFSSLGTPGVTQVKVKDALDQESIISGQVYSAVTISPLASAALINGQKTFSATGGKTPYVFAMVSGGGSINPSTGVFTAPGSTGTSSVKVTDALGQEASTNITIAPIIAINATACSGVVETQSCTISATGGQGTRTFSTNKGSIDPSTGLFTGLCSGSDGSHIVSVTDSAGNVVATTLNVPCALNSCADVLATGYGTSTGVYWLDPDGKNTGLNPFQIVCNMDIDGGGWEVVQMRNSSTDFYKYWADYKNGFGTVSTSGNYWIGNDRLNKLTPYNSPKELYVAVTKPDNSNYYQRYPLFSVKDAATLFVMNVSTLSSGTAGNPLLYHNGRKFTTRDSDNDIHPTGNCASTYNGAWWYGYCHNVNINGLYGSNSDSGIIWNTLGTSTSLIKTQMLVRKPIKQYPRNCREALAEGALSTTNTTGDGEYIIDPDGRNVGVNPITTTCDMTNGGFTLINNQFPYSSSGSVGGCASGGYGTIDSNAMWQLSSTAGTDGSSTHGGCGISLKVRMNFSYVKLTNASFTSNLSCGSMWFPNVTLNIASDLEGPVDSYNYTNTNDQYYPGWTYLSHDGVADLITGYNQYNNGLGNGVFNVVSGDHYLHLGVASFTGCHNRPASTRIWVK